jgi:thiol:disulfide interchange protein DsbD
MKKFITYMLMAFWALTSHAQEAKQQITWKATAQKTGEKAYRLIFTTENQEGWDIYSPDIRFDDIPAAALELSDSSIQVSDALRAEGQGVTEKSQVFEGQSFLVYKGKTIFLADLNFTGEVPAILNTRLSFTYGKADEFFPGETAELSIPIEEGKASATRILIPSINPDQPLQDCGTAENKEESSILSIFLLGFLGGLFALLTPCVFPMVPLTVSYFTKHGSNKEKGKRLAVLYGLFIFLIYISFSIPFHLLGNVNPAIYNKISTNVYLNTAFFAIFIFFAISFFGYFEITLPGGLANSANAKQGSGIAGVFFMALTLAIVSFSCTGPILGTLLVGTATEGAWPLTAGLAGFGLALGLPFGLFALFPQWLNSLPKSGSWLNTVKVVLGFIELALALKFLSNADLVAHWGLLKREIFFGIWILIFVGLSAYLLGWIRFPHDDKEQKISLPRKLLAILVLVFTAYITPGITNTKAAHISLVSGFPPPVCYSVFSNPVNCDKPLTNYEEALKLAKEQNKPILIDFTGWACVNCRKMEENVWTKKEVQELMDDYILVSLYVDDKELLPATEQQVYTTKGGLKVTIKTVGTKWSLFQTENFNATSQPWYVAISPDEKVLSRPVGYTPDARQYADWLKCGLDAFNKNKQ